MMLFPGGLSTEQIKNDNKGKVCKELFVATSEMISNATVEARFSPFLSEEKCSPNEPFSKLTNYLFILLAEEREGMHTVRSPCALTGMYSCSQNFKHSKNKSYAIMYLNRPYSLLHNAQRERQVERVWL